MPSLYTLTRPLKSDSTPIRGDGYEPGLRSSDLEPTQRRRIACGQDLVVVVGIKGSSKKFSDGKILKNTTVSSLYIITTTLFSYLGHLYDLT